jgi:hypothetical protein
MFTRQVMKSVRFWRPFWLTGLAMGVCAQPACGTKDGRPGSFVSVNGNSGGGGLTGQAGSPSGEAGQTTDAAGSAGMSPNIGEGGVAGEFEVAPTPLAIFPRLLEVDVGCGMTRPDAALVIQNGGALPLSIVSASANSGFVVKSQLPLSIAPQGAGSLVVTPPVPRVDSTIGEMSSALLSFVTNEPGSPTRQVTLNSTLYGARVEFADKDGASLGAGLTLSYLSSSLCPDSLSYRVHNTGNVAFTLFGPNFPDHLRGTSTGASGLSIAPDDFLELTVGGDSSPGAVCGGLSGVLSFTVMGAFCGTLPSLHVTWPANSQTNCACSAAAE